MIEILISRFRRWFEYEQDSHTRVLASLEAVPAALRSADGFQQALDLMGHIVAARRIWLYRLGALQEKPVVFPKNVTLDELPAQFEATHAAWSDYLNSVTDDDLVKTFEYQSLDGKPFRNTVEDILAQLFGHSWYHRGQIASRIKAIGGTPAVTDLVFWSRELIEEPTVE
ncbi:MAG: DinB family protein [Acidobacteria bacterium]|nr:DinB family protein [Acidobacteriota bacterium]